ncbi:hypothetical protein [Streptomyces sp. 8N706]|uniref:hypothetical protein n=1 Tax=Streptomyces sp. 8N706 TaxID=3457416 RepID=UPI003FD40A50
MSWMLPHARAARRVDGRSTSGARVSAVRASVFTVVSVFLAVTAHHLVSDGPVPWGEALFSAGVLFTLSAPAAPAPRSMPAVVTATTGAQAGLHYWLARVPTRGLLRTSPVTRLPDTSATARTGSPIRPLHWEPMTYGTPGTTEQRCWLHTSPQHWSWPGVCTVRMRRAGQWSALRPPPGRACGPSWSQCCDG